MDIEKIKHRRQIFNIINIVIVILLALLAITDIIFTWHSDISIFAWVSLALCLVSFIVGVLLPSKDKNVRISKKTMDILVGANVALNRNVSSMSLAKESPLFRTWHYGGALITGILMILINFAGALECSANNLYIPFAAFSISMVLWLAFIFTCSVWSYYDFIFDEVAEYDMLLPDSVKKFFKIMRTVFLIVFCFFGIGALYGYFSVRSERVVIPTVDIDEVNKQFSEAQDSLNALTPEDFFEAKDFENIGEALAYIKALYDNGSFYYSLQYTDENKLNIISWEDSSDDVLINSFAVLENGRLKLSMNFISSAMTKADVIGKETGIVE